MLPQAVLLLLTEANCEKKSHVFFGAKGVDEPLSVCEGLWSPPWITQVMGYPVLQPLYTVLTELPPFGDGSGERGVQPLFLTNLSRIERPPLQQISYVIWKGKMIER